MGNSREATLTLRLIDRVSGPARASVDGLNGILNATRGLTRATQVVPNALSRMGRSARRSAYDSAPMSAGLLAGASAAGRAVFQYEKMGNAAEAVGLLTEKQRAELEAYAKVLNNDFPFVNKDILEASFELLRSGQNFEQMLGSLRSTLNTSLAGDIGLGRTADIMTNVAQSMRLPMETTEQVQDTMRDIANVLAYGATNSNTDIEEMAVAFRYVAPLAAATGMSLREMATATMMLANNGIKGSNAGTGLRFALIRMLKPTKEALKAFDRLNINIGDFVEGAQKVSANQLTNALALDGIDVRGLEEQIDEILHDPRFSHAPARLIAQLTDLISREAASEGVLDSKVISDSLSETLLVLGTKVDLRGFLNAVRDNPDAEGLFPQIFGQRHAAKLMAILASDFDGALQDMTENAEGAADRMARIRMKGLVGDVAKFRATVDNLIMTLSETGVMESTVTAIQSLGKAFRQLSELNPKILEFGTYAALAGAAVTPLLFALSGLGALAGIIFNPIVLAGLAVAALVGYLSYKHWEKITAAFSGFWKSLNENLGPRTIETIDQIKEKFSDFWTSFTADHQPGSEKAWREAGERYGASFASGMEATLKFSDGVGNYFRKSYQGIKRMVDASIEAIEELKRTITEFINWSSQIANEWFSWDAWTSDHGPNARGVLDIADEIASLRRQRDLPSTLPGSRSTFDKALVVWVDKLTKAKAGWSAEADGLLTKYLELKVQNNPEALREAEEIGQKIERLLSVTAKPTIDQSSLDSSLQKAKALSEILRTLHDAPPPRRLGPTSRIAPSRGAGGRQAPRTPGPQSSLSNGAPVPTGAFRAVPAGGGQAVAVTNHNTFQIHSTDPDAAAAAISRRLDTKLARARTTSFSGQYG